MKGIELTFTAHNIELPDGTQTLPGHDLIADSGTCRAALRDLKLAFPSQKLVRIADLGCLEGGYAAAFARAGYDVTGFEVRAENFLCCQYVAKQLALPNLRFLRADVRGYFVIPGEWDAVFCSGLLYHLENPASFLNELGRATRRMLIVQSHYSTHPEARHEGHRGHWYQESTSRWSAWKNEKSFWMTRRDLMAAIRGAGFDLVFEQADWRADITTGEGEEPDERGMFVGLKLS